MQVLCDFYDKASDDPKVVIDAEGIFRAIECDDVRGEYKWSQLFKKDEIQTGRRVWLAYGLQFINQMGGVNIITVSVWTFSRLSDTDTTIYHSLMSQQVHQPLSQLISEPR